MKAGEKREIEKFRGYLHSKDYCRINRFLVKTSNDFESAVSKDYVREITALTDSLKIILHNDLNLALANNHTIKFEWISIISLFDQESQEYLQSCIVSTIIKRELERFATDILDHSYFYSTVFIKRLIEFYEKSLERLKQKYGNLPSTYNLMGEFTFHYSIAVKKKLSHLIYNFKVPESEILSGMKLILDYEQKYQRIHYSKMCCKPQVYRTFFDGDVGKFEQLKAAEKLRQMKPSSFRFMVQNNEKYKTETSVVGPISTASCNKFDMPKVAIEKSETCSDTPHAIYRDSSSSPSSPLLNLHALDEISTPQNSQGLVFGTGDQFSPDQYGEIQRNSSSSAIVNSPDFRTSQNDQKLDHKSALGFDSMSMELSSVSNSNETVMSIESTLADKIPYSCVNEVEIQSICEHRKMLSRLFLPYLQSFVKLLTDELYTVEFDQTETELNIYSTFLRFFNSISVMVNKIDYFGEMSAVSLFLKETDEHITRLIQSINKRKNFIESCITLNTVLYIEKTFGQLCDRLSEKYQMSVLHYQSIKEIRKIETEEYCFIEDFIKKKVHLSALFTYSKFAYNIFQFVRVNLHDNDLLNMDDDVLLYVVESIISYLFAQILTIKMKPNIAHSLLDEFIDLKLMLLDFVSKIPLSEVVESYLKIFIVPSEEIQNFVENFQKFSNGMFAFSQILKILENNDNNLKLYMEYKKSLKVVVPGD